MFLHNNGFFTSADRSCVQQKEKDKNSIFDKSRDSGVEQNKVFFHVCARRDQNKIVAWLVVASKSTVFLPKEQYIQSSC